MADEIRRLGVESVYLMGGVNAQSAAVQQSLRALGDLTVTRVSGPDRFHTAAAAADAAVRRWRDDGTRQAPRRVLVPAAGPSPTRWPPPRWPAPPGCHCC